MTGWDLWVKGIGNVSQYGNVVHILIDALKATVRRERGMVA